jgi:hypothetical protein
LPFDSTVAAVGLIEALAKAVLGRIGVDANDRTRWLDELRGGVVYGEVLQETLEVLADPGALDDLDASGRDVAKGRVANWEDVKGRRRRR